MENIFHKKIGRGWPVILIHGFCETHEIWDGFAEKLSEKFQLFVIDLPGFGKSPLPKNNFKISDIGSIILDWIDQEAIHQPVIIGHSLGGYVVLAMAKQKPEKISGLGLFQSTAYPDSEDRKANRNRVIEFVRAHGIDPFIDTFVPGLFYNKKHPAIPVVDKIARTTLKETFVAYTEAMRDRESSIEFIKSLEKPLLILGGKNDGIIPQEITEDMERLAPKSTVCLLKSTGHMAMYESPAEALRVIEDFVNIIATKVTH